MTQPIDARELTAPLSPREMAAAADALSIVSDPYGGRFLARQGVSIKTPADDTLPLYTVDFARVLCDPTQQPVRFRIEQGAEEQTVLRERAPNLWTPLTYGDQPDTNTLRRYISARTRMDEVVLISLRIKVITGGSALMNTPIDTTLRGIGNVRTFGDFGDFNDEVNKVSELDARFWGFTTLDIYDLDTFGGLLAEASRRLASVHLPQQETMGFEKLLKALVASRRVTWHSDRAPYYHSGVTFLAGFLNEAEMAAGQEELRTAEYIPT